MFQPGDRVGRYEIQRRLGRGATANVYVAHDPFLGRMVALKMFSGDLDASDAADRFFREARAAAALNHVNIVTIHDVGEFEAQPFIVMEYVQGETLERLIRNKADLSLHDRLRIMEELCAGVAYAHGFDVIHRDIKPANLIVDRSGQLRILDFGIARMRGSSLSRSTALVGTPGYMAPEQIRGEPLDKRSDLFSVGVVCYELLSFTSAFPGDSFESVTHRILSEEPASLSGLVPEIPAELVAAVERALKKNPSERFPDAPSFGAVLAAIKKQVAADPRFAMSRPTIVGAPAVPRRKSTRPGVEGPGSRTTDAAGGPAFAGGPASARDELIRRRAQQVEAALRESRARLHQGDYEAAREYCLQALTLDDTNPEALALERATGAALTRWQAGRVVEEARDELERGALTVVEGLLQRALEIDPDAPEVKKLDLDLRLARVEQKQAQQRAAAVAGFVDAARAALDRGDAEAALVSVRQALQLDPQASTAREIEGLAYRRLVQDPADAPTVVIPRRAPESATKIRPVGPESRPSGAAAPPARQPEQRPAPAPVEPRIQRIVAGHAGTVGRRLEGFFRSTIPGVASGAARSARVALASLSRSQSSATSRAAGQPSGRPATRWQALTGRHAMAIAGMAAVLVVGLLALFLRPMAEAPPAALPTGRVVLDAVPWARVVGIRTSNGSVVEPPAEASTPLTLSLPAGTYRISVVGPDGAPQELEVSVASDQVVTPETVRFATISAEEYFAPFLTSQPGQTAEPGAGSSGAVDPAGGAR